MIGHILHTGEPVDLDGIAGAVEAQHADTYDDSESDYLVGEWWYDCWDLDDNPWNEVLEIRFGRIS